jgi:outer membrane protein
MKPHIRNSALVLGLLLPLTALAENLVDVFKLSLENDPEYQAAEAGNRAAREAKPQALAQLLPNLSLSGDYQKNHRTVNEAPEGSSLQDADFNTYGYTLNLTQPVFRYDRFVQYGQAKTQVEQANAQLEFDLQQLIIRSSEAYFNVLRAIDQLVFTRTTRKAFEQQLNQAQQRFEVGLIAITDVEEAKAGFDTATTAVIQAKSDLENAEENLRDLIGVYVQTVAPVRDPIPLVPPTPNSIEEWTDTALTQNRQLSAAQYAAEIARQEIRRTQAGHLPTVDVVAARNFDSQGAGSRFGSSKLTTDSVGLQLTLPIFEGGLVTSQTRQARDLYRQSLDQLEDVRRQTQREARSSFLNVTTAISQVQSLKQQYISTQKAQEAIEAGFQVGTRTSVDVLNAQRDTNDSLRQLKGARYDYLLNILRLKAAAGTLSPEDVTRVNEMLATTQDQLKEYKTPVAMRPAAP